MRVPWRCLRDRGCPVVLTEAGPSMFGSLVASQLVDELFLTVSPILAGRAAAARLGLVEGVELPQIRVAGRLRSVRATARTCSSATGFARRAC